MYGKNIDLDYLHMMKISIQKDGKNRIIKVYLTL